MDPLQAFRLDGSVVVLSGASSGLGVGFARTLSDAGAHLVLAARRLDQLQKLAEELPSAVAVRCDVSSEADCRAVAETAVAQFGPIDVVVNNAGTATSTPAQYEAPADFRNVVDINLVGTFQMSQACIGQMPRGGSIVNVASVHALAASRFPQASYAASKAGVIGLTRDLAQQWTARRGVRVNALAPGYFASEMTNTGREKLIDMVEQNSLVGRFGEQREIDPALLFLASPASSYVTGSVLVVDGGLSATV